jgi:hypothetical protein
VGVFFDGSETHERRGQGASVETAVVTAGRRELAVEGGPPGRQRTSALSALVQENRAECPEDLRHARAEPVLVSVPAVPAMAAKGFLVPTAN